MTINHEIAKHVRGVYRKGNWTVSSLEPHLADVDYKEATTQVFGLNSIATLTFHLNYYVHNVANYLAGEPFQSKDKEAFAHPPINSEDDWQSLKTTAVADGERFAKLIESLPDDVLLTTFIDDKYGNYFRNLIGIVEHIHYHLGQIVLLKKVIRAKEHSLS